MRYSSFYIKLTLPHARDSCCFSASGSAKYRPLVMRRRVQHNISSCEYEIIFSTGFNYLGSKKCVLVPYIIFDNRVPVDFPQKNSHHPKVPYFRIARSSRWFERFQLPAYGFLLLWRVESIFAAGF